MHSDKEDIMTKLINILNKVIEVVMVVLIVAMVCGNFWQIFTRFVLNNAASWTEEFLRYALIWLTMLGVPYAYSKNKHIAIEFVADTYSPKAKIVNQILIEVLVLFIAAFVMIGGGIMVTGNALGQTSPALGMPMQFYYLGVPVCGILLIIYTIPRLIGQIREYRNK
jgi:TRAP-type C4-dicarboxylate transport system permease small subunit